MPDLDMRRMQEEAARRAREMQSRARQSRPRQQASPSQPAQSTQAAPPAPPPAPPKTAGDAPPQGPAGPENTLPAPTQAPPPGLLEELFKDRERTVLLALLILLGNESGNHELMFALLFLLM